MDARWQSVAPPCGTFPVDFGVSCLADLASPTNLRFIFRQAKRRRGPFHVNQYPPMSTSEARMCETCLTPRAIADFRLRSRGGTRRMRQCNRCHAAAERQRRAAKRDRRLAQVLTRLKSERSQKRIMAVCDAMLAEFGGVAGFVAAWRDYYRRSTGLDRIRCLNVVLTLLGVVDRR
jgi:hypothetical protein